MKRAKILFQDKSGKKTSQQHLWVTMALGTQGSLLCDVCMKHSTNKPLLHCDSKRIVILSQMTFVITTIVINFYKIRLRSVGSSKSGM